MKIKTIISYCSLESRFIEKNIEECSIFSDEIIVSCFLNFLGTGEKDNKLEENLSKIKQNKKVKILINEWSEGKEPRYWHNLARINGWKYSILNNKPDYILFLDADEIPEGILFKLFLKEYLPYFYKDIDVMQFGCHYYFREPIYETIELSGCGALWKTDSLYEEILNTDYERWAYKAQKKLKLKPVKFIENVLLKGHAMFHHFSWVRTKEEMLKKVTNWGHKNDVNDWKDRVEKEMSQQFKGIDFFGKQYKICKNYIGI